ncbi:MAG: O-methyltransferase [Tenuifilaceae bacterium]|jgi:predicted O-methyltransferase YrrM|nr:O-methyltransferase [Tenuifilaceae bacterium]
METGLYHSNDMEDYLLKHTTPEDKVLYELNRHTHLTSLQPRMLSGPIQGKLLEMLSRMLKPHRILEIGTYTGYSALCLAKGLAEGGQLHTIEVNDEVCETALDFFRRAGAEGKITLHEGSALDIIPQLDEVFDLVLIDGDKRQYPQYLEMVLPKVKSNGYILADNVLWGGKVLLNEPDDAYTKGVMDFNDMVADDNNLEQVLLPLRDGLMLIRKL